MSRVLRGVHVEVLSDAWEFLKAARPALVKVVNADAGGLDELRRWVAPDVVIVRLTNDHQDLTPTPWEAAERWWRETRPKVQALAPFTDYFEVPVNEAHEENLGPFAQASARYVELAAAEAGVRCIVGNLSRGNPPHIGSFAQFAPALEAAARHEGALGLHQYFHRGDMDYPWQIGRETLLYTFVASHLRLPVFMTEYGLDNGDLAGRRRENAGWRDAGYASVADYVADLDTGVKLLSEHVAGVCVYTIGHYADRKWASFDSDVPEVRAWVAAGPRLTSEPVIVPPTTTVPVEEEPVDRVAERLGQALGGRFDDARRRLPDGDFGSGVFGRRDLAQIAHIAIHHSAGPASQTVDDIYRFHTGPERKWSGVGYSFVVAADGRVSYCGDIGTVRANVLGYNHAVVGVCFIGNFKNGGGPNEAQMASGRVLVRVLREVLGWRVPLGPHLQFTQSECPGRDWQSWLGRLETEEQRPQPAPPQPKPSPFVVGQGVRDKMATLGDEPASHERYIGDDMSLTLGASGRLYIYGRDRNSVTAHAGE